MTTHAMLRTFVAGVAGGTALNVAMVLTFRLIGFGWSGGGLLLDPTRQSPKLIAVWTDLESLPLIVTHPGSMALGLMAFGVGHAYVYGWLARAWPRGVRPRALRFAALLFVLCFVFWEVFTPFNQLGEPLPLVGLELVFRGPDCAGRSLRHRGRPGIGAKGVSDAIRVAVVSQTG